MRITTDNFPIYIALACTSLSLLAYIIAAFKRNDGPNSRLATYARRLYLISVAFIAYASVYLLQQILSLARYDIDYIFAYSAPTDDLLYRISALWAGHEGSLLFWALIGGLIGLVLIRKKETPATVTMAFWCSVQLFFLVMLAMTDPFKPTVGYQAGMVGMGINPILKNPWMAIHPPVVFLGYAALMVPAAMAVQALIKGDLRQWAGRALPWAVFGWATLGAGLILGMIWSYEVLGWGGYWGWDPVENLSLLPWLTGTALLHGLIMQRYKGRMAWANVGLALSTFLLVICATVMTRSGLIAKSQHSFANDNRLVTQLLLGFLAFYVVASIVLMVVRRKASKPTAPVMPTLSKDFAVAVGGIVLVLFGVAVLVGTIYGLMPKTSIDSAFYTKVGIPIAIVTAALIVLASLLGWSKAATQAATWRFSGALWKSGSHVAHLGVLLMIAAMFASSHGENQVIIVPEGGAQAGVAGYVLSYEGRELKIDKETVRVTARRGTQSLPIALTTQYTRKGDLRKPRIISSVAGDFYVSLSDVQRTKVTPKVTLSQEGWTPVPEQIPGTDSYVTLAGMQADNHAVKLEYQTADGKPTEMSLAVGTPATVDGYTLEFERFVGGGDGQEMGQSIGLDIAVKGNGLGESAVIDVSWKPLMWLLWLGMTLITLGGLLATWRRFHEKRAGDDGILPDSI